MKIRDFTEKARQLGYAHRALPWYIGDILNEMEHDRGEVVWQYVDQFGISPEILKDYAYVSSVFPEEDRIDYCLSIWYFREVARLGRVDALSLLKQCIHEGWSSKQLRAAVKERHGVRFPGVGRKPSVSSGKIQERKKEAAPKEGGGGDTKGGGKVR